MTITTPDNLIRPNVDLRATTRFSAEANAYAVIGAVTKGLREVGNDESIVKAFIVEAMADDYDHTLAAASAYAEVS